MPLAPPRWLPVVLALPALIPLAQALWTAASRPGQVATGFIQYDMAYYLANARGHFQYGLRLFYPNPYADYGSPAIYAQPQSLVYAALQALGLDPGVAFNVFGLATMLFAAWAAVRLYTLVVGWGSRAQTVGLICFFWGGGLLALVGSIAGRALGLPWARAALALDPGDGWWMLNLGRNLVYPQEAYYHGLFLLTAIRLIERRFGWALGCASLLSASHPFTGLSLALIVSGFLLVERQWKWALGAVAILAAHLGYYLVFLNRFPDHRALGEQWKLEWSYLPWTFAPALALVGFLALMRFTRMKAIREAWAQPANRLFAIWFVVIFGLTQHDLFIRPMQPIHFAHGYDWIALFLLAAPLLIGILGRMKPWGIALLLILFLGDNAVWFATFATPVQRYAITLTNDQWAVLEWLRGQAPAGATVVSEDADINYLTATYSSARAWHGHVHNTPHAEQRKREVAECFAKGAILPAWRARTMFYIPRAGSNWRPPDGAKPIFGNGSFRVWVALPASQE